MKKSILLLSILTLPGCLLSQAEEKKAVTGTFISGSYRCAYLAPSEYGLGVDLYDCVANGVRYQKVVAATNVFVQ